jgi:hypothetical protein
MESVDVADTSKTDTGRTVSNKLVLVFAAMFAIMLVTLSFTLAYYNSEVNKKDTQISQLNAQLDDVEIQIANLTQTYNNLTIMAPSPRLVSIPMGMNCTDNRVNAAAPFVQVTGYVVNVGTAKAEGCTIHMYAVRGNSTVIDTSVSINSLDAGAHEWVNVEFPYSGEALTVFTSNLNWAK